jgi:ATP-binding cassette, sub-family E, member 1
VGAVLQVIRDLLGENKYVIVVEHDLAVLDYLSDFICCLYGKPGAYGVVTMPFSVREGINIFLAGFVPTENLRFREEALTFKVFLFSAWIPASLLAIPLSSLDP